MRTGLSHIHLEIECQGKDGTEFKSGRGTIIGYPQLLHQYFEHWFLYLDSLDERLDGGATVTGIRPLPEGGMIADLSISAMPTFEGQPFTCLDIYPDRVERA